jgi:hypothetical protein
MSDFDEDFNDFLPPPVPEDPNAGPNLPFPLTGVDLLSPPGFVGQVASWIDSQCRYPRRRLAVASAIATVGNIGGLRHEDMRDGVTANLLLFCVAASATGKEAVQQAMAALHRAAGVHYALQGGIKSEQEIMRNLIEHQAAFYLVDEIGIFLGKVRSAQKRGGAAYLEGVFGAIMSAYSKANSHLLLQGDTKRELRKMFAGMLSKAQDDADARGAERAERMLRMVDDGLERPFLSLVGYTTPSTFDGIMDGETATQGFVGRALIVSEPDINPEARRNFRATKIVPDWMAHKLAALYSGGNYDMGSQRIEWSGALDPVTTTDEADRMLIQVSDWLHGYADEMGENTGEASVAMIRRAFEAVAKVSFILGMADGMRTADHVRWAFAYVREELDAKIKLVFANDNATARPEESMAARLLNYIDPDKGSTLAVLANRVRMPPAKLEPILRKMQAAGMVREGVSERRYRGKNVIVWHGCE